MGVNVAEYKGVPFELLGPKGHRHPHYPKREAHLHNHPDEIQPPTLFSREGVGLCATNIS
jgi:hypothetical protein